MNINTGRADAICDIDKIEKKYKATWVGQLSLKTTSGNWTTDNCGDVYYQEYPLHDGFSKYFALVIQQGDLFITSGASAVEGIITAVEADDGEIIYSRYTHDYRCSQDDSVFIDGGRSYVRTGVGYKLHHLKIVDGKFVKCDTIQS